MSYVGFMVYNASAAEILAKEKDVTEVPYFAYGEREREREGGERGGRERGGKREGERERERCFI